MTHISKYDVYEGLSRSAEISECGLYRWWLRRSWKHGGKGSVCFVMLNPSTADALQDDPTIRRCMGFCRSWGYSQLVVKNLFAYRATDPKELLKVDRPTGGKQNDYELMAAATCDLLIAAWGAGVPFRRDDDTEKLFRKKPVYCLGTTKHGHPKHPLYVRADQQPIPFRNCMSMDNDNDQSNNCALRSQV